MAIKNPSPKHQWLVSKAIWESLHSLIEDLNPDAAPIELLEKYPVMISPTQPDCASDIRNLIRAFELRTDAFQAELDYRAEIEDARDQFRDAVEEENADFDESEPSDKQLLLN